MCACVTGCSKHTCVNGCVGGGLLHACINAICVFLLCLKYNITKCVSKVYKNMYFSMKIDRTKVVTLKCLMNHFIEHADYLRAEFFSSFYYSTLSSYIHYPPIHCNGCSMYAERTGYR